MGGLGAPFGELGTPTEWGLGAWGETPKTLLCEKGFALRVRQSPIVTETAKTGAGLTALAH